jgi:hypothetical protein
VKVHDLLGEGALHEVVRSLRPLEEAVYDGHHLQVGAPDQFLWGQIAELDEDLAEGHVRLKALHRIVQLLGRQESMTDENLPQAVGLGIGRRVSDLAVLDVKGL